MKIEKLKKAINNLIQTIFKSIYYFFSFFLALSLFFAKINVQIIYFLDFILSKMIRLEENENKIIIINTLNNTIIIEKSINEIKISIKQLY